MENLDYNELLETNGGWRELTSEEIAVFLGRVPGDNSELTFFEKMKLQTICW